MVSADLVGGLRRAERVGFGVGWLCGCELTRFWFLRIISLFTLILANYKTVSMGRAVDNFNSLA